VTVHRCFAWDHRAKPTEPGGALWVPRDLQGDGRHDNPEHYGCLYVAERAAGAVVEQLARFRGNVLVPAMLTRRGLQLGVATIELDARARVVDFDDPVVLSSLDLRPSRVATRLREVTQPQALAIHASGADGIRWWSTFEASWCNLTLFDRGVKRLRLGEVSVLQADHAALVEALDVLGIATG
jgi:hypothetical protein